MKLLLAVLFTFPLFHSWHAPPVFRTRIDTTAGSFVIETHLDWSAKGADRFYELVREHYYDNSRFFRVVPGRWVQFGIAGDPKVGGNAYMDQEFPKLDRLIRAAIIPDKDRLGSLSR